LENQYPKKASTFIWKDIILLPDFGGFAPIDNVVNALRVKYALNSGIIALC